VLLSVVEKVVDLSFYFCESGQSLYAVDKTGWEMTTMEGVGVEKSASGKVVVESIWSEEQEDYYKTRGVHLLF